MRFWLERIADLNTESMRPTPVPGLSGHATGNVGSGESGIRTNAAVAVVSYFSLSSKHCGLVVLSLCKCAIAIIIAVSLATQETHFSGLLISSLILDWHRFCFSSRAICFFLSVCHDHDQVLSKQFLISVYLKS
jgi:hypothetical protein